MTRLIVIGIDGMDPIVFEKLQGELPHLSLIQKSGCFKHCNSVFPPDSIPAWVSIFTGEYPEQHGWLDNIDYEDIRRGADVSKFCNLQGRTFWDRIGQAGKRVCIINPFLAYPVWPVNGVMASGPVFITGEKQIFPKELTVKNKLPDLGGMIDFPAENELEEFLRADLQSTRELAQFGLNLLTQEQWDLFFISFFTLDRIQHFLWRFWDVTDPLYPGPSNLDDSILKAYKNFDEIVGQFLKRINDSTGLVVLSDHGHGQRPTMLLNLNEALRQAGFLKISQGKNRIISPKKTIEIIKNASIWFVARTLGERWLYRIGKMIPKKLRKALKQSSYLIDKLNSIAWLSDMGGGASSGGIVINPKYDKLSRDYSTIAEKILEFLKSYMNEGENGTLIQWARVNKESNYYPDLIFELSPDFSIGRSLFCPIVEKSSRHQIISGGHKKEGVLFSLNCEGLSEGISSVSDCSSEFISFVLSD